MYCCIPVKNYDINTLGVTPTIRLFDDSMEGVWFHCQSQSRVVEIVIEIVIEIV